ncbi:MAG: DUF4124 domain-containing protein [Kangiella sp.]|jgi:hypothetical protein|nr:DUF4124 domain-containing protein [Kangiella sp.]MCW9029314.1 DUF4124 domain-containing protein [Kangiella sp.]
MSLKAPLLLKVSLLIISSVCLTQAGATVLYKKVDKDGNVTFTDKPSDDAEAVTVQTNKNVIAGPRTHSGDAPPSNANQTSEIKIQYDNFAINSPNNDERIRSLDGSMNVVVDISPQIRPEHSIRLHIDGARVGQDQKIPYFNLLGMDYGSHELTAVIIHDQTKNVIQTSKPVTFYLSGN